MRISAFPAVRLRVTSDLHVEKVSEAAVLAALYTLVRDPDVHHAAVMAGDLADAWDCADVARETYPNACAIVLVPGNHEGYGCTEGRDGAIRMMRERAARLPGVHVLHDDVLDLSLPYGAEETIVRFIGTTLWTDYDLCGDRAAAMALCDKKLNDHRTAGGDQGAPPHPASETRERHLRSRAWMRTALAEIPDDIPVVAVTHHLPSLHSVAQRWRGGTGSATFASHADELLGRAHLFVHGHTHDSCLWRHAPAPGERRTLVTCNPLGMWTGTGYHNNTFNPRLDIELFRTYNPTGWTALPAR